MQYRSKLQTPSFRGINFGIKDISTTIGRRTVQHEYPKRSDPYVEDLGRKGREFNINGFVLTPDDYTSSQKLIAALESYDTPGTFVHPTLGAIQVMPRDCTHSFNNNEGGIEYFTVTLVETLGNNFPNVTVDTQNFARTASNNLINIATGYFTKKFLTRGLPDFIAFGAQQNVVTFANKFRGLIDFGSARNNNPTQYSKLITKLKDFTENIPTLVYDPAELAKQINDLNTQLNTSFSDNLPLAQLIQNRLYEYGTGFIDIVPTTNLREIEKVNQDQLIYLIKNASIAQMIKNVSLMKFASVEDAVSVRDNVDNKAWVLLQELGNNFQDDIYTSLSSAVSAMILDVKTRAANSATIHEYTMADSLPAFVLAYEYLEDAKRVSEIVDRNHIANPLIVPPGTVLQVAK